MTKLERIEAIKWNIQECEGKIRDLNRQRGQFTSFNGEEFESIWEYDKYVIDAQIKDLEEAFEDANNFLNFIGGNENA